MPAEAEHKFQADHNRKFTLKVDKRVDADWHIAAIYYEAVHLVRSWLAARGSRNIRSHDKAWSELERLKFPDPLTKAFKQLETLSRDARYECYQSSDLQNDIADAEAEIAILRASIPAL